MQKPPFGLDKDEMSTLGVLYSGIGKILDAAQEEPKAKAKPKAKATGKTPAAVKKGGIAEARSRVKEIKRKVAKGQSVYAVSVELEINYAAVAKALKELEDK